MAQRFLFFNSTSDDRRKYDAKDFSDYFGSVLSTGVLHVDEQPGLFVSVEQGTMNTIVGPGKAIMKGHLYENTTPHTLTHSLPEPNLDRIDRIVLRLDLRQSQRNILLHVKEGQPAENPEPPALQRDNLIYEISLARILVRRNTSSLQPIDLQDERLDEDVCGLVYSLISIPTSQFQEQWETFYNTIKNEMDTETQAYFQRLAQNILQFEQDWDAWFSNQKTEGFVMQNEKGQPNGVASLDENAKVPLEQLPPLDFIPTSEKGAPGGVATLDNEGEVPKEQLLKAPRVEILFGNGMDGDVTISSNTTLTRDMYYNNLTINSGRTLKTNGYKIFVKGTLINNGTIDNSGENGGNGGFDTTGRGGKGGVGGGDGGDGHASSSNNGGNATGGGSGGRGGAYSSSTSYPSYGHGGIAEFTMSHRASFELLHNLYDVTIGGGGGGGGGQSSGTVGGGGGGGGGGRIHIYAKEIINNGYIRADGGNGGNGYDTRGGGGGGGGGGFVLLVYQNATFSREPSVKGGSHGTIANPQFPPTNGEDGRVIKIKLI